MNILFLTLGKVTTINDKSIYLDLLRCFVRDGHKVFIVTISERRNKQKTKLEKSDNVSILHVKTGNIRECGFIEKGITTLLIDGQYKNAIKKYFKNIRFNLVIYSTPPITFSKTISFLKKKYGTNSYLLLKDIFPQNAVDLGVLSKQGLKKIVYSFFKRKEKKLYYLSDYIGCMSEANRQYIIKYNSSVCGPDKVEVSPNSYQLLPQSSLSKNEKKAILTKYNLPLSKTIFVYGGNLGKPQDVPFIIRCIDNLKTYDKAFFLIIGKGTEKDLLHDYLKKNNKNFGFIDYLPQKEYSELIRACDVGLIFLNYKFTIPNYPSRLLCYLEEGLPVLAATDLATDIKETIEVGHFGCWCPSNSVDAFKDKVVMMCELESLLKMSKNARQYFEKNFDVESVYRRIANHFMH